jgi:hypothetical protein
MIGATGSLGALALTHSGRARPVLNTALMVSLFYLFSLFGCGLTHPKVFSAQAVTIAMARDFSTGLFCCQASYNTTSQSCGVLTQNSNKPFPLANAGVIFNRTSGSVGPNATVVGVAATTTVLAGKGGSSGASTGKEVGLGVGLGISLGVLLLIALGLLWRSIKQRKNLERQLKEYTRNNGTRAEWGQQQVYEQKPAPQAYQPNSELEARSRAELEGR